MKKTQMILLGLALVCLIWLGVRLKYAEFPDQKAPDSREQLRSMGENAGY